MKSYGAGKATGSWGASDIHWRAHVACWAASQAARLPGDFIECGVNRGGLALTTMRYTSFEMLSKRYFLLDTFNGLDSNYVISGETSTDKMAGAYTECYDDVCKTFADSPHVVIVRGSVPDTLPMVDTEQVAYLSLDMNCVQPEVAAADYFWPKLVPGAIMLLDDYGWPGHEAQREGFDEFAGRREITILSLPTGQGVIVKP
jgi:O-methyltransferase